MIFKILNFLKNSLVMSVILKLLTKKRKGVNMGFSKLTKIEAAQLLLRAADAVLEEFEKDGKFDLVDLYEVLKRTFEQFKKELDD